MLLEAMLPALISDIRRAFYIRKGGTVDESSIFKGEISVELRDVELRRT